MDKAKLEKLLRKQRFHASLQGGLILMWIFLFIFSNFASFKLTVAVAFSFDNFVSYIWLGINLAIWIPFLISWIMGIVNAVKINSITKESTLLVVFAVLVLFIGHSIVVAKELRKYGVAPLIYRNGYMRPQIPPQQSIPTNPNNNIDSYKALDNALKNGIISPVEYEKKKKELKRKEVFDKIDKSIEEKDKSIK